MQTKSKLTAKFAIAFVVLALSGCQNINHSALKNDMLGYSRNFAEATDRQMLLNLARLANDDPASFMQLASVSSSYTYGANAGTSAQYVKNNPAAFPTAISTIPGSVPPSGAQTTTLTWTEYLKRAFTFGGTANVAATENPIFQLVPLSGSNVVAAVLNPIPTNVFYHFYDQGYPADWVARTMIKAVRIPVITTNYITNYAYVKENSTNASDLPSELTVSPMTNASLYLSRNITGDVDILLQTNFDENHHSNVIQLVKWPPTFITNLVFATNTPRSGIWVTNITLNYKTNYDCRVNSPHDPSYPRFIEFCDTLWHAQTIKSLILGTLHEEDTIIFSGKNPKLKDVISATQSNLVVKFDTKTATVTISKPNSKTTLIPNFFPTNQTVEDWERTTAPLKIRTGSDTKPAGLAVTASVNGVVELQKPQAAIVEKWDPNLNWGENDAAIAAAIHQRSSRRHDAGLQDYSSSGESNQIRSFSQEATNIAYNFKDIELVMMSDESAMYTAAREEAYFRELSANPRYSPRRDGTDTKDLLYTNLVYGCDKMGPYAGFWTNEVPTNVTSLISDFDEFARVFNSTNDCLTEALRNNLEKNVGIRRLPPQFATNNSKIKQIDEWLCQFVKRNNTTDDASLMALIRAYPGSIRNPHILSTIRPLLRLTNEGTDTGEGKELDPNQKIAEIDYPFSDRPNSTHNYFLGDFKGEIPQNRLVFTMLTYLFDQTTVSTQNLPPQSVVRLQ